MRVRKYATMSNYIIVEMRNNCLMLPITVSIEDLNVYKRSCIAKIDTGCSYSTIPYVKLNSDVMMASQFKGLDIHNEQYSIESYGVESSGIAHKSPVTFDEKMKCTALKFRHDMINVAFNEYQVGNLPVFINYDRRGNILIGMDVLSKFIIYIDTSRVTGKETLIMTLKSEPDKSSFYDKVKDHFNIVTFQ